MQSRNALLNVFVHRRTGGLESLNIRQKTVITVHRRTGGLENFAERQQQLNNRAVHRRTGGLENSWSRCGNAPAHAFTAAQAA